MVLVLLLIFLVPIASYCLVLAWINRSSRAVMASGVADLVGLLLALSGFLFVVGPRIIKGVFERAMEAIPLDSETVAFDKSLSHLGMAWLLFWVIYYVVILAGIALGFWWRRNTSVIYNVDLATFESAFTKALDNLGLAAVRDGKTLLLTPVEDAVIAPGLETGIQSPPIASPPLVRHAAALQFEYFPALCHVTLRWSGDSEETRDAVEVALARAFRDLEVNGNPASLWFLGVGGCLVGIIFVIIVLLLLIGWLLRG